MRVMAIDPGKDSSFAISGLEDLSNPKTGVISLSGAGRLSAPDGRSIGKLISENDISLVVLEEVGAMPKQGVSSIFTFGLSVGCIMGAVSASSIPLETVRPPVWKKPYKLNGPKGIEAKRASLCVARQLFPGLGDIWSVEGNHGQAEACLMLHWRLVTSLR